MKSKIISLFILICALWSILLLRAGYLQFLPNDKLNALQARQFQTVVTLPSRRGSIYDRFDKELAMSSPAYSLYADTKILDNKKNLAKQVGQIINMSSKEIYAKIKDKNKRFIWLSRLISSNEADQIRQLKVKGLGLVEDWKRVYPNDSLLSSTLGFVGKEGQALEGLELHLDSILKGEKKKINLRKDARGRPLIQDGLLFTETPQGKEVHLTIDADLQYFVETELEDTIKQYRADGGWVVVLDAKTSAIRALANFPHFDPNKASASTSLERRNRAVTDTFEPGSTIKTFVIASALDNKIVKPNSKIFCENGAFKIGKRVIHEAEKAHAQGTISVTEILAYSSNIGTSKIALMMGDQKVKESITQFGFGQRSGLDLPGEAKGITLPLPWRDHLLANISFGHGMTATPVQIANAYAAIANGGVLNKPYIVDRVTDPETNEIQVTQPQQIRRVISSETAAKMRLMLTSVTADKGTGIAARVPGYIVGGKTGTAQKIKPFGKGYLKDGYIASFSGFIPANEPQLVIFVGVDYPKKIYYGSQVAAPLFSKIASYAVRRNGVSPEFLTENTISPIKEDSLAQKFLNADKVIQLNENSLSESNNELMTAAPEFKSLTLREVLTKASEQQIDLKIIGSGRVESTIPSQGHALDSDRKMTIYLK